MSVASTLECTNQIGTTMFDFELHCLGGRLACSLWCSYQHGLKSDNSEWFNWRESHLLALAHHQRRHNNRVILRYRMLHVCRAIREHSSVTPATCPTRAIPRWCHQSSVSRTDSPWNARYAGTQYLQLKMNICYWRRCRMNLNTYVIMLILVF
jgi:hypothetical protein